jgi:hypothetical protein
MISSIITLVVSCIDNTVGDPIIKRMMIGIP